MLTRLLFLALAAVCPLVSAASAAYQFHLNVNKNPSICFLQCHQGIVRTLHNKDDDPLGNLEAIGGNCADPAYAATLPTCLIANCASAADVAYAVEFGRSWCGKAGVDIEESLVLPESYTGGVAKEYFQSEAYLSSAPLTSRPSLIVAGAAISLGPLLALVF